MTEHPDLIRAQAALKLLRRITVERAQILVWLRALREAERAA